jgi:hypothetical protein
MRRKTGVAAVVVSGLLLAFPALGAAAPTPAAALVSNVVKAKDDAAKQPISNIR